MKYLFILGISGSGKTMLAEKLQELFPKNFKKAIQNTTRQPRQNERENNDYYFLTNEEYNYKDINDEMLGQVREELLPALYGTNYTELDKTKVNILVLNVEGFLDAISKVKMFDKVSVLFISNVQPEIERENRNVNLEERYISLVLHSMNRIQRSKSSMKVHKFNLIKLRHEKLKEIRNSKKGLSAFIKNNRIK